jgi:hypothetical protein
VHPPALVKFDQGLKILTADIDLTCVAINSHIYLFMKMIFLRAAAEMLTFGGKQLVELVPRHRPLKKYSILSAIPIISCVFIVTLTARDIAQKSLKAFHLRLLTLSVVPTRIERNPSDML